MADPVSKLNHIVNLLGWVVTTFRTPPEGPSHIPTIKVSIRVEGQGLEQPVLEEGEGRNKRIAKQAAATAVLLHPDVLAVLEDASKTSEIAVQVASQPRPPRPENPKDELHRLSARASQYWAMYPRLQPGLFRPVFASSGLPGAFRSELSMKLPNDEVCVVVSYATNKRNADQQASAGALKHEKVAEYLEPFKMNKLPLQIASSMGQDVYALPPPDPLLLTMGNEPQVVGPASTVTEVIAVPTTNHQPPTMALTAPHTTPAVPPQPTQLLAPSAAAAGATMQHGHLGPAAQQPVVEGRLEPLLLGGSEQASMHKALQALEVLTGEGVPGNSVWSADGADGPVHGSFAITHSPNEQQQQEGCQGPEYQSQRPEGGTPPWHLPALDGHAASSGTDADGGPITPDLEQGRQDLNPLVYHASDGSSALDNNNNGSDGVLGHVGVAEAQPLSKRQRVD